MGDTFGYGARPRYGHYSWDIANDLIWGDAGLAQIMGLDATTANDGFSVLRYLDIVHPDDRENVAKAIKVAVLSGRPYLVICRLQRGDDIVTIRNRGACLRYRDGLATVATGMLDVMQMERGAIAAANLPKPVSIP